MQLPLGNASLFDTITSAENLFLAWERFCRGKRHKPDVQLYERYLEANVFNLRAGLLAGQYRHGAYRPFVVHDPKKRQIHKAKVKDRLVHQSVSQAIEPLFERRFVYHSFSCRRGKGTHAAVSSLQAMLRKVSKNNTRTVYALKLDIRRFFASVDQAVLKSLLRRQILDARAIDLLDEVIGSFWTNTGTGIPLGNVTSQLFANIYLHELDWFVKQSLQVKCYIRYCDDFVILDTNRDKLVILISVIQNFLVSKLCLSIHPNKIYVRTWHQGIDFLGYVLKPQCVLIRTKTKNRMLKKVSNTNLGAYLGVCKHANAHDIEQYIRRISWE